MDEFDTKKPMDLPVTFFLATVYNVSSSGVQLKIDGQDSPTTKRYKKLITGATLLRNDRILVMKISGTYVVLGKIAYS